MFVEKDRTSTKQIFLENDKRDAFYLKILKILITNKTFLILIGLVFLMSFLSEYFLTIGNIVNIIRQVSIYGIIAMGMTLVIIMGGIDLSIGAIVAIGGVVAANLIKNFGLPIWEATILAIFAGFLLGFLNGIIISKLKIAPFVITLAMMSIARGLAYVYVDGMPIVNLPKDFVRFGQGNISFLPGPIFIFIIVIIIAYVILHLTKLGRYIYYIGGNENAAIFSGINVTKVKTIVYALIGAFSALSGVILTARINSAQPQAGLGYELDVIAMVIIGGTSFTGGTGTIAGTCIGVLIIGIINNALDLLGISSYYQMIVKGLVIASAVILDVTISNKNRQ